MQHSAPALKIRQSCEAWELATISVQDVETRARVSAAESKRYTRLATHLQWPIRNPEVGLAGLADLGL